MLETPFELCSIQQVCLPGLSKITSPTRSQKPHNRPEKFQALEKRERQYFSFRQPLRGKQGHCGPPSFTPQSSLPSHNVCHTSFNTVEMVQYIIDTLSTLAIVFGNSLYLIAIKKDLGVF